MKIINVNLGELGDGSLQERFDHELAKVAENVWDRNTDHKVKRQIIITIDVLTDEYRDQLDFVSQVKSKLAPREKVSARVLIEKTGSDIFANELRSGQRGQIYFDDNAELKDDTGRSIEELEREDQSINSELTESNVIKYKKTKEG